MRVENRMRLGPWHPWLAAVGFWIAFPVTKAFYAYHGYIQPSSKIAKDKIQAIRAKLKRGENAYVVGIGTGGIHNTGAALIQLCPEKGAKIICNNEEERFSGKKHTTEYPRQAIDNILAILKKMKLGPEHVDAWVSSWDYARLSATWFRAALEESPASLSILFQPETDDVSPRNLRTGLNAPKRLGAQLGLNKLVPIIQMQHHDNHAWFSFCGSPFAKSRQPVIVAVLDGMGDRGAITLYVVENGALREWRCNESLFDSLGAFYSIISSTQGGWTLLSSEGRYMGAAAYGNLNRLTNPFYSSLREIFSFQPDGRLLLNRSLANWPRKLRFDPYSPQLAEIIGAPIALKDLWNPDAVLQVEDIEHSKITQERVDKAAATQMVLEDAIFHIISHAIRETGSDRLIVAGGVGLNALANMHLLDHFDERYYQRTLGKQTRLHLWVPPTPSDTGVTIGAAYMLAYLAGITVGPKIDHAFYCGTAPAASEIRAALESCTDVAWLEVGNVSTPKGRDKIADLMAFVTEQEGVAAILQGPGETGPRALGHRSILANPCSPNTREVLNRRVKYREAIRPLAPMMTLAAAKRWFELSAGAADDDYNAYNYMVITARAKPDALSRVPAVIHADGTSRIQIVRENSDPLIFAYLKALGRRIGVEIAVNTSFNVAGPIVQTPLQAIETLRRSKGMDVVFLISDDGLTYAIWLGAGSARREDSRFPRWLALWQQSVEG